MITAELTCNKNGALLAGSVSGHALFAKKGSDIVCAAVSVLMRTSVSVLQETKTVQVLVKTPKRGELSFTVTDFDSAAEQRLVFAADFLRSGLHSLQAEYPAHVAVTITIE